MRILSHCKSIEEHQAFMLGYMFALGIRHARGIAFDANTNNPYWVTTENGHRFLIDLSGVIQTGRFKGHPIAGLKEHWQKDTGEIPYMGYHQTFSLYKYEERLPEHIREFFDEYHFSPPNEKQLKARSILKERINSVLESQDNRVKTKIENFKINNNGLTKLPSISISVCKELGIKPTKKMVLTYPAMKRILASHPEIGQEELRKGIGLGFFGNTHRFVQDNKNFKRVIFQYHLNKNRNLEIAFDLKETEEYYEIMHYTQKDKK